jgi:hypothetical protein
MVATIKEADLTERAKSTVYTVGSCIKKKKPKLGR